MRIICRYFGSTLLREQSAHSSPVFFSDRLLSICHTEYNRHGVEPKDIELPNTQGVLTRNRVNPDIIVHQPGHDDEDILVIEVKKSTNAIPDDADLLKLEQIKRQIGYRQSRVSGNRHI